jgi:hypothetical protein
MSTLNSFGNAGAASPTAKRFELSDASADTIFRGFVLLHLVVWTALPALLTHTLPEDVVEGLAWGQEWQLGYYKHPPLQAWLLESVALVSGRHAWALYLLSQLGVAISFWAVWRLARMVVSPLGALISVLLLEGVVFLNYRTPELNPDVVQLPFWALATLAFYRALRFGRAADWCLLGLWMAVSTYGKYETAVLGLTMVAFMLAEPQARRSWRTAGPYIAACLYVVLLLPHAWWAASQDFPTAAYVYRASRGTRGLADWLGTTSLFTAGQLASMAPAALMLAVLSAGARSPARSLVGTSADRFDRRFVATLAFGPFVTSIAMSAATGRELLIHWGCPMWSFIGLFAVMFLTPTVGGAGLRRFAGVWIALFVAVAAVYAAAQTLLPYARQPAFARFTDRLLSQHFLDRQQQPSFPGPELAREITARWHARFGDQLSYVVGNKFVAGNVAFFSPDHPSVLIAGIPRQSPWVDMNALLERGAVVLSADRDMDAKLEKRFPPMEKQVPIVLPWDSGAALPPVEIVWWIIPPRRASGASGSVPER